MSIFFNQQVCDEATNLYVPTRENANELKFSGTFSCGVSAKKLRHGGKTFSVPRHKTEVKTGTAVKILKDAGLK